MVWRKEKEGAAIGSRFPEEAAPAAAPGAKLLKCLIRAEAGPQKQAPADRSTLAGRPLRAQLSRAPGDCFAEGCAHSSADHSLQATPHPRLPAPFPGSTLPPSPSPGQDSWPPGLPSRRLRRATLPSLRGGRRGQSGERKAAGKKGQTLKLPGCGLRSRMLSGLSTSWQQQHGPARCRRRCGNGAARVAEPVIAPGRSRREARSRPPLGSTAAQGTGTGEGSRAPSSRVSPPRGGPAARGGPARAGRGAAPRGAA